LQAEAICDTRNDHFQVLIITPMVPQIAIMGAGPGGCMLARLLHQQSIPCTIFEGEESVDYRSQGGTLDLRTQTGLQAIKEAGLFPEFKKYARYDGESLLLCDKNKRAWLKRSARKSGEKAVITEAPEIDRAALRRILMESVPDGVVRWGMKLKSVDADLSLHFVNGVVERDFDLIVGADGAFSKTRQFLSSERPFYTGIGGYDMQIPDAAKRVPEVYK
jgi:2-polyprenyl-6-methoxyphenol hydroxylase-like FAD-dependent oxidoreductase